MLLCLSSVRRAICFFFVSQFILMPVSSGFSQFILMPVSSGFSQFILMPVSSGSVNSYACSLRTQFILMPVSSRLSQFIRMLSFSSGLSSFLCLRPADHGIGDKTTVRIKDVTIECKAADLQHRRYLGHGAYGLVEEVVHLPSNTAMAVKVRCSTVSWRQRWLLCKVQHCLLATMLVIM